MIALEAKRDFKDRLYPEFARIGEATWSAHRLEILDVLAQGKRTVESLATETGLLHAHGRRAQRPTEGFPEWRPAGRPASAT